MNKVNIITGNYNQAREYALAKGLGNHWNYIHDPMQMCGQDRGQVFIRVGTANPNMEVILQQARIREWKEQTP